MWDEIATGGFNEESLALPHPLHNLEHGQIVLYYNGLAGSEADNLRGYADDNRLAVVAAPAPAGVDAKMTLTGWTKRQSCDGVSSAAIEEFRKRFQGKAPEGGAGWAQVLTTVDDQIEE